jgi:atlastin
MAGSHDGAGAQQQQGDKKTAPLQPPFQRLEFLVRDSPTIAPLVDKPEKALEHMSSYLESVFGQVGLKDLRTVRAQILECFRHISCFMLPHPGATVAEEPSFVGNIEQIRDKFRVMFERYAHVLFEEQLEPKRSPGGHSLTARELGHYMEQYVSLFQDVRTAVHVVLCSS